MARIGLKNATSDGVGALDVTGQASALGQTVAQQGALRVGATGRWILLARVLRWLTWHCGRFALVARQTEALDLSG